MKLSIIIPVYNAEKYLKKCLESIFVQDLSLQDYEVIAVDDGSTDSSLKILENYKEKYHNLNIISQKNQGEAGARNTALKIAKGDFITFLDNDDYYNPDTLVKAIYKIEKENLDILYLAIHHISEEYQYLNSLPNLSNGGVFLGLNHERRPFPATMYRREIIGDRLFPLDILVGTDSVFNALVQSKAKRVSFSSDLVYNYLVRPNSLSKKAITEEGYQGFINAINILDQFKNKNFSAENKDAQQYFDKVILVFLTRIVELHILPNLYQQKYRETKKLLSDLGYWHLSKSIAEKYPYFDSSFAKFALHQKKLIFKTKVYQLLQKLKP
ncbi:glycosyltransferase family 2 protein [Cloacibacterium sp.]|uniref:glycosyltransferase family 2 protein n=1 Tax=Cloacibacterium sp. TaxID=1913682 RepID=UPI0039E48E7D